MTVNVALDTRVGSGDVTLLQGSRSDGVEFTMTLGAKSVAFEETAGRGHADDGAPVGSA
jgi:hypothetical protein